MKSKLTYIYLINQPKYQGKSVGNHVFHIFKMFKPFVVQSDLAVGFMHFESQILQLKINRLSLLLLGNKIETVFEKNQHQFHLKTVANSSKNKTVLDSENTKVSKTT